MKFCRFSPRIFDIIQKKDLGEHCYEEKTISAKKLHYCNQCVHHSSCDRDPDLFYMCAAGSVGKFPGNHDDRRIQTE